MAGAQSKFAIARIGDQGWAYPHGNAASTHIIKPGISRYAAQAFNEHLCLRSLRIVGIAAASTEFTDFDGVSALVVKRYDRLRRSDGAVLRLHQEDLCQALSVWPDRKYATDGGPSATQIAGLLAREATQHDVDRFTDTVIAQYLLGAPDAHAKNYSVILNGAEATLAPIYDLHHVAKFARSAGTDPERLTVRTRELAAALPDAVAQAGRGVTDTALVSLRDRLAVAVAAQCASIDSTAARQVAKPPAAN